MRIHYCRINNFGDRLNETIWSEFFPWSLESVWPEKVFVGVGTILRSDLPQIPEKIVFGSGCGYGESPAIDRTWRVYCVRGPCTTRALGLGDEYSICDPGLLIKEQYVGRSRNAKGLVYMPHLLAAKDGEVGDVCRRLDIGYIDPQRPVNEVISQIQGAGLLLTEAMHGAVAAVALNVPWLPIRSRLAINGFKWLDFCRSLNVPFRFCPIAPVWSKGSKRMTGVALKPLLVAELLMFKKLEGRVGILVDDALVKEKLMSLHRCRDRLVSDVEAGR